MSRILENSAWRIGERSGVNCAVVNNWLGAIGILKSDCAIIGLDWHVQQAGVDSALLREARRQLAANFAGEIQNFELPPRAADRVGGYCIIGEVQTKVPLLRHEAAAGLLI